MASFSPASANTHPFGQEEQVSQHQLYVAFCNHLKLGQWELVRACANGLLTEGGGGTHSVQPDVRRVLEAVIEHPFDCSLATESIPSAHHLAWLALQEHKNLTTDLAERLPHSLSALVEFRLLLYNAIEYTSAAITQDVYHLFIYIQDVINAEQLGNPLSPNPQAPSVTDRIRSFLKVVVQHDTHLGNSIISHLKLPVSSSRHLVHNQNLEQVYLDCLTEDISVLQQAPGIKDKLVVRIYKVLSLMDPTQEMIDLQLDYLFLNLLDLSHPPHNYLQVHSIYSSLLGRGSSYLIRELCRIERRGRTNELNSELKITSPKLEVLSQELRITLRLAQMKNRELAWKEMFQQTLSQERHILANLLDTCMTFVRDGMYNELVTLLSPTEFAPLKSLVLLLGWNYVNSCDSANRLLDALYASSEVLSVNENLLDKACSQLTHQVQLVQWCLEKTRPFLLASGTDPSFDPRASKMFHELDSRSVLHMLHHATNLGQLNPVEVFDILSKKPQLETKSSEGSSKSSGKSVHFEEPQKLSVQQERDIAIYRSFLVLKSCMLALANSTHANKPKGSSGVQQEAASGTSVSAQRAVTEAQQSTSSTSLMSGQAKTDRTSSQVDKDVRVSATECDKEEASWEKAVIEHLREARCQLSLLYPLTYRLETLENVFSLLFTRSEDAYVGQVTVSDSGGEEGIVDEDWQNKSATSLESTPKHEQFMFDVGAEQLQRISLSVSDSRLSVPRSCVHAAELPTNLTSLPGLETLTVAQKRERTSSGSVTAKKSNTERSSELHSQPSSNCSGSGTICFVASEDIVDALLNTLKECLSDLSEARYSLAGPRASIEVLQEAGGSLMKYMDCSVSSSTMAQRISQITQRVNEARWRYQLVSQTAFSHSASQRAPNVSQVVGDSSSDEELFIIDSYKDKEEIKDDKLLGEGNQSGRFSSQSGRSGSDGSTTSSKRRRKRRKRRQSATKTPNREKGVVARMLASQDTLLRMCLHRGSYGQALQVVKMFELADKPEVSEVYFAEHWEQSLRRLHNLDAKPPSGMTTATPLQLSGSSSAIATMAASGAASLSVSGIVDDLLATSMLPLLPTTLLASSGQLDKHSLVASMLRNIHKLNVAGVLAFDLACTACRTWRASKALLEMALGRLQLGRHSSGEFDQSFKPRVPSPSGTKVEPLQLLVGILPFVNQITNLVAPLSMDSTALIKQDILDEFFQRSASEALLQATKPLDAVGLRLQINALLEQRKALAGLRRALQAESDKKNTGLSMGSSDPALSEMNTGLSPSPKGRSAVHHSMSQLLQTFDKTDTHCYSLTALLSGVGPEQDGEYSNYLMSLYGHVSVLSSLLVEAKEWYPGREQPVHSGAVKAVNPFCVLQESPSVLLGRLMFQNQIPPTRLEGVADQLKLNLMHVIVRSCCPTIPMHIKPDRSTISAPSVTKDSLWRQPGKVILNDPDKTMSESPPNVRHPEVVAKDLLSRIIMLMKGHLASINPNGLFGLRASILASSCKDYLDITEATKELAFVDLEQLETGNQRLGFFANVMNLLLAHASLHHIHQQLISKDVNQPTPGHTRHSSLTERIHTEDVVTLPGTSSRQLIERITYLNKMAYRIGQLGVVSAFELRYIILRAGLHPPSCFNNILLHRLHGLGAEDPWQKYLPPAETRLLFVISNGCRVSPVLQVLQSENIEEQLELAMQQFLENYVVIDDEKLRVTIPKQLDWFRKDFTGKSLGTDVEQGHIYGGLLNVVAPHMSKHIGQKLESFVLSCSPGKIQLEEKPTSPGLYGRPKLSRARSFRFTVRIEPYDFSYGYKFIYHSTSKPERPVLTHRRSSSQPESLLNEALARNFQSLPRPTFSMTESTLVYLHSKSKLVASLVGLVSMSVDDRPDSFALKKSFESSGSLLSFADSPVSLVFDDGAFGEQREFFPEIAPEKRVELSKMLQHVAGYSPMLQYVACFMTNIVETAEALQAASNGSQLLEGHPANSLALTMRNAHACSLANPLSSYFQSLVYFTLDHLITYAKWKEALEVMRMLPRLDVCRDWLPDLPIIRDFVLCCAARADLPSKGEDMLSDSWRALLCLQDKDLCARTTLGLVPRLPVCVALHLLEHCSANPAADTKLKDAVFFKLNQLKTYHQITEYAQRNDSFMTFDPDKQTADQTDLDSSAISPSPYISWQRVAEDSWNNPQAVLGVILEAGDFELAKTWASLHDVYHDLKETIHEKHLLNLFQDSSNTLQAYQILEGMTDRVLCERICRSLLDGPVDPVGLASTGMNRISLASTVFLVQFMMDHFLDLIAMEQVEELQALSLGAKALLCLSEPERSDCEHLVSKPLLILEQLLMNTKIEQASTVLSCLRTELQSTHFPATEISLPSCNGLIASYSKKAIQLSVVKSMQLDFDSTLRSVSSQSVTSPSGQRKNRGRVSVTSMMSTLSPSASSLTSTQSIPIDKERAPSPTPSIQSIKSIAKGLSPRGQSLLVTPRRRSVSSVAPSVGGSADTRTGAPAIKEDTGLPTTPPKREKWVPDLKVTHCMVCKVERFSMFNRRHHCRRCGRVVCWRCSQLKAVVEGYGDTPVRVCDQCYQTFIMPRPQHGNMSSLEQRLKVKHPGSRQSPGSGVSPGNRTSPSSWQHRTPMAASSMTSMQSAGTNTLLMADMEWQLTLDPAYAALIRQDFYFEQAPSTSVCLSILDLHSDHSTCGTLILQMCCDLSEYLRPIRPGVPNPEVDYNLIISMMKTLLFNAKLRFIKDGDSSSIELCDSYRSFVDLLSLFVRSNSADIPSIQQLANADSARQVRDRLVLAERLSLATEMSTKCGLDPSAVWSAWGMSCLRAGDYLGAREKFARILKVPSDKNSMSVGSKLLMDIIQYLETSASQADTAQAILNATAASIRDFIAEPTNALPPSSDVMDNLSLQECRHYIITYCPHIFMVQFYLRHNRLPLAASYIREQHCSSDVFLEGLLVPCMKQGILRSLQTEMLHQDPTLAAWNNYLTAACRYLNAQHLSHVLYDWQLFMKDFIRASMTCIRFYQSGAKTYSDLFDRLQYLTKAKEHMKAVLDEKQWDRVPRPPLAGAPGKGGAPSWGPAGEANIRLIMSPSQLTNHMNTISLQTEVTKFLHRMASSGKFSLLGPSQAAGSQTGTDETGTQQLPTLFGNSKIKAEVAYRVLLAGSSVNDGFQMAFQIIQDFRLPDTLIYSHIGRRLAKQHKYKDIHQLLNCVRGTGLSNDQCCDEILDACVRVLASDTSQAKEVEGLIKLIKNNTNKINALMLCGKLKSAYLIAVKEERMEDVQRILSAAQRAGPSQAQMKTICESWLASQAEKKKREMKTQELLLKSRQERR